MLLKHKTVPYIGIFKLPSGEEFIATVVDDTATMLEVAKPLCIVPTDKGLDFAPFLFLADLDATVSIPKPIITGIPNPKIEEQYKERTSAIVLPKQQSIII